MNKTEVILSCRGLSKRMPSGDGVLTILDDINLEIREGEFSAILGRSGSGKSTLLGLMAGLDRASAGDVFVRDRGLSDCDESELARLRREEMGFVFQSFQLLGNLTAEENVRLPLELTAVPQAGTRALELLEAVGLGERRSHFPSQLSGGEQQRVALARAFGPRPALLLADEPTGNLDAETGGDILELLLNLRQEEGTTLVLVTHDQDIAQRADRVVTLEAGRLVSDEAIKA